MKKIKLLFSYFVILMIGFVLVVSSVSAQEIEVMNARNDEGELCDCNSSEDVADPYCAKYCTGDYEINDFVLILVYGVKAILGLVGSLALIMFVYGGLVLLTSAGNPEKVTKGKTIMINALIGIVIVFTSYMIIQFTLSALKGIDYNQAGGWNEI